MTVDLVPILQEYMREEKIDIVGLHRRMLNYFKVDLKTVRGWVEKEAIPFYDRHRWGIKKMFPEVYLPPIPQRKRRRGRMTPIMLPGTPATFDRKKQR